MVLSGLLVDSTQRCEDEIQSNFRLLESILWEEIRAHLLILNLLDTCFLTLR